MSALLVQVLDPAAAIGGDDADSFGIGFEEPGHKVAAAGFKMAQNLHFAVEARVSIRPVIGLVNAAVETTELIPVDLSVSFTWSINPCSRLAPATVQSRNSFECASQISRKNF